MNIDIYIWHIDCYHMNCEINVNRTKCIMCLLAYEMILDGLY